MKIRWMVTGVVTIGLAAAAVGGTYEYYRLKRLPKPTPPPALQQQQQAPKPAGASGRYLFSGSIFWGRYFQDWSRRPDGSTDYNFPFAKLGTFKPQDYDAWIAELECPVTNANPTPAQQEAALVFNCRPEFLDAARQYFDILSLADNHTDNQGAGGFDETRIHLERASIQAFGHYDPARTGETCEVVALPVKVRSDDGKTSTEQQFLPVALCAWHYFYRMPLPGELEAMQAYAAVMPVIAFLHMGREYRPQADGFQRQVARRLADLGAQFVIANSPHWVQDAEVHGGRLIMYSTGNFIFDQQQGPEVTRSASLDVRLAAKSNPDLKQWLDIGRQCVSRGDGCLDKIRVSKLQKLELAKTDFAIVAGQNPDKQTHRADAAVQAAVEERLNWAAVSAALLQAGL